MLRYIVLLLLLAAPTAAQAQPGVLDAYVAEALRSNLALHQHEIDLQQSLQALNETRGLFWPELEVEARYTRAGGGRTFEIPVGDLLNPVYGTLNELLAARGQPGAFPTITNEEILFMREREQDSRLRLTQPLFQPHLLHNYRMHRHLAASQEAAVAAFRRQLVHDVKVAYYQYLKAERAIEIYEATLQLVAENERVNDRLLKAHQVTQDAVYRARADVLEVEQQAAEARTDRNQARAYFNFLLNRPLDTPVERIDPAVVLADRSYHLAAAQEAASPAPLQQHALGQRDELHQLDEAVQAAASGVQAARSSYLPSVLLVVDAGIQGEAYGFGGDQTFYAASVVMQWNLFEGFQKDARVQQARLNQRQLEARRDELRQQIRLQVQEAYDNVLVAEQRSLRAAEERLRSARSNYRLVARRYDEGLATQMAFIDARTTLTQAEHNLNVTQTDLLIRLAELEYAAALDAGTAPVNIATTNSRF